ncbi:site-specific integrase [Lysobacter sp. Root690]|uniref:site-specific integrase n=1 Tax=Lysobacter sp. Root690 TaxID=1736588 RepID=UPI0006F9E6ED|nr:site-specific integrase [Lysobacter sp. Root690]KRB10294.1 integrase [Lysobacter sp. Root690]
MESEPQQKIRRYIANPYGVLCFKHIRIGTFSVEEVRVKGREAAISLDQLIHNIQEKAKRWRGGKHGTRTQQPLPMFYPARVLSLEIRDHLSQMTRKGLNPKTVEVTTRTLKLLQLTCGDIPVTRINYQHIHLLWEVLRWAPPGLTLRADFDTFTPEHCIELGKAAGVPAQAPATFERHRRFLVSFFNQLVRMGVIPQSPMAAFGEIKRDLAVDPGRSERLFDDEELQRIFSPESFVKWARNHPHRWWAPMIGLYTGARINEVCQLKLADIIDECGVWCIAIRKTVDPDLAHKETGRSRQSLKGKAAVRTLPIPQPLLNAGFLDFVDDIRGCGHPRLFPHLSAGVNRKTGETNAHYSAGVVKQFSGYLKSLGFPKGVGFHAFRHTLATDLHHQGVPDDDIALLTGHSVSKRVPVLHDAYFHKKPMLARKKQIAAFERYRPLVTIPVYQKGQFKKKLADPSKFYP